MLNLISTIVVLTTILNQSPTNVDLSELVVSYVESANQEIEIQVEEKSTELQSKILQVEEIQNDIKAIQVQPRILLETIEIEEESQLANEEAAPPVSQPAPVPARIPAAVQNIPTEAPISSDYRLIIPAIGVDAPIISTDIFNEASWKEDLLKGVGHYGANPGEGSKIVLTAHSSWWVPHEYGELFRYLYKLKAGDQIHLDYQGQRYSYEVMKQEVVGPNTPSIVSNYGYEELLLFTCWPYNSWTSRLVVYTKKI